MVIIESIFRERLRRILIEKHISQKKMAEDTGIKYKTLNMYLNKPASPSIEKLVVIANYLSVSSDYLTGLVDDPKIIVEEKDPFAAETPEIWEYYSSMQPAQKEIIYKLMKAMPRR